MSSTTFSVFDLPSRHTSSRARSQAAFLAFQGRPRFPSTSPMPRKRRTIKEDIEMFIDRCARGSPPSIPSYLHGTAYAALVQEQYDLYNEKCVKRTARSSGQIDKVCTLDPASIPADSFTASLISYDLRLPSAWNPYDTGDFVSVSPDGMELTYKGTLSDDSDVSAARSNFPCRPQCAIFYYEVEIVSKGVDGHIGIGFCWPTCSLDRLPGWEDHSWGYHGDDGHLFSGPGTSRPYGPKFGTGDIIGCGIDYRDMSVFYTMNGIFLGTAFRNIVGRNIYPFVGFKTPGEHIRANFGQKQFVFDIEQYYKEERRRTFDHIVSKAQLPTTARHGKIENSVIFDYLLHHGYAKSAKAFKKRVSMTPRDEDSDLEQDAETRQNICNAVIRGDVEEAIAMCNEYSPSIFDKNTILLFRLRCRQFLEMAKKIDQQRQRMDIDDNDKDNDDDDDDVPEYLSSANSKGKSKQYAGVKRRRSERDQQLEKEQEETQLARDKDDNDMQDFQSILEYGNKLKNTYSKLAETDPKVKEELAATFSVIAYANLGTSAVSHLYDPSHNEKLAEELNSAMLAAKNKNPVSTLERIYRQTSTALTELSLLGDPQAAMFVPKRDCLVQQD